MEFAQHFPSFLWVVRDFTVKLERQDGRRMSPHDYLEDALKPESGVSDATEQKNTVRNVIRSFFPERDCVTMVRIPFHYRHNAFEYCCWLMHGSWCSVCDKRASNVIC